MNDSQTQQRADRERTSSFLAMSTAPQPAPPQPPHAAMAAPPPLTLPPDTIQSTTAAAAVAAAATAGTALSGNKRLLNRDGKQLSEKKLRRLEKNRLSARECRRRKREATENLERQINVLEGENLRLRLQLQVCQLDRETALGTRPCVSCTNRLCCSCS